ncbi:unnamed protein product [Microthlaspi erraticum]|uniref:F-box domain-containing protein n=1 Tax=Microthlaspi erraticum TaxID=1685480 RepID=A0A6D2KJD5_9BRAS|nr:unnamed protein product [Microthlaspi erraticum]
MRTERRRVLPEAMLVEIIARLPLRSIARFKSVCKTWKSLIESPYFRRLFISLHQNSSASWSLMFRIHPITEAIGFHGCETWDLPKSLASYILPFQRYLNLPDSHDCYYVAASNGLVLIEIFVPRTDNMPYTRKSFVGNPVLQEWFEIPPPPEPCEATGLVTRVEDDGVVSSFKVVRTCQSRDREVNVWRVCVYSSVTGKWTFKRLVSSHHHHVSLKFAVSLPCMNLNGMIYVWVRDLDPTQPGVLVSHDFYGPEADYQCPDIISLPVPVLNNKFVRRCLTTSGGHVFLVQVLGQTLKLWKLDNNSGSSEWWQLSGEEINLECVDCCPMAMNPFDSDIVYLWSRQHGCLVSVNLRTKESEICGSVEGCCVVNTHSSKEYMEGGRDITSLTMLSQFVLPKWMDKI